jgi:hypothetical protein
VEVLVDGTKVAEAKVSVATPLVLDNLHLDLTRHSGEQRTLQRRRRHGQTRRIRQPS